MDSSSFSVGRTCILQEIHGRETTGPPQLSGRQGAPYNGYAEAFILERHQMDRLSNQGRVLTFSPFRLDVSGPRDAIRAP